MSANANPAIYRAMQSPQTAIPQTKADLRRPLYHFRSPARWLGDINGPIYHNGYYHIFYRRNPYDEMFGTVHWGHARSEDLVFWEYLPIALWPSSERGEEHCYSGVTVITDTCQPMIFYTGVPLMEQ